MSMIDNDWLPAIKEEYSKPYYKELFTFVKDEYSKYVVYPPADDIFNAFHFTPLSKVKVLILGQDPYHNVHQAHGLSFSVLPGEEAPPSLKNIYKELHDDCGELAVGHDLTAVEFDPPGFQELVEGRAAWLRVRLLPHAGNREGIEESQHLAAPQDELVECEQHPVAEILRLERQNHVDIRSDFSAGNGNLHHVIVAFEFGDDPPRRIRRAVHHHRGGAVTAHHRQRA